MGQTQLLQGLRDIHTPPIPESLSPWPVVAAAIGLAVLLTVATLLWARRKHGWARNLAERLNVVAATSGSLTDAAKLLRQTAILKGGTSVAKLRGDSWLDELDRLFATRFFTGGAGRVFGEDLYLPPGAGDASAVIRELEKVVRRRGRRPW